MSEGTFDARLSYAISYPSKHLGLSATNTQTIKPIEAFDNTEDIRHVTVNSLNSPHMGLLTVWGDFTGTLLVYETSNNIATLEELRQKQLYFDLVVVALDEGGGTDYKIERSACVGCKLGRKTRRHRYGTMPQRLYQFTYCSTDETIQSGDDYYDFKDVGTGKVTATIGTGVTTTTTQKSTDLETV
jgi:hypothetical protein